MTLNEVSEILRGLRIPTSLTITPINLEEEKKKFFDSDTYNPQFKYFVRKNNNNNVLWELSKLEKVVGVDKRISDFYIQLISDKKMSSEYLKYTGNNEMFSKYTKEYFGMPSYKLFTNACLVLKGKNKGYNISEKIKGERVLSPTEVKQALENTLKELGLNDWIVKESINIPKNGIRTAPKDKKISFDKNIERSKSLLKKSIIHEIGTHVLRSYNGSLSGVPALYNTNVRSYLEIEEGLAMYNEESMGVLSLDSLRHRALMVYAIYVGENMSFRTLYNVLRGFCKPIEAFDITYRVKRGLSDTSKPGIYPKDMVYFKGFRKVRKRLEKNQSLYAKLYAGKIDLDMVKLVDDGIINKPSIVPSKEMFDSIFQKIGL